MTDLNPELESFVKVGPRSGKEKDEQDPETNNTETPKEETPKKETTKEEKPKEEKPKEEPEATPEAPTGEKSDELVTNTDDTGADEQTDTDTDTSSDTPTDQTPGSAGTIPSTPRSAKFNIYETDQMDKGGVPFSEVFLEAFKFLGDNFTKTVSAFTNATFGLFSKPVSSMRVLGETAIKYGQGASARIEQAYRKHGNAPWVQKTDTEDLAAAQQAIMNTFISDISEVSRMDLDQLMDRMMVLSNLRSRGVDLNGTSFYGVDESGNIVSPTELGLLDLVSYVNGDRTCGGRYAGGVVATSDGTNYAPVSDRQVHQLRYYANEYKAINDTLRTEYQIRKFDVESQRKAEEYARDWELETHRKWIMDPVKGVDHITLTSNGISYKATPAQVMAREFGIMNDKGLLDVDTILSGQLSTLKETMDAAAAKIYTDTSLTDDDRNQLRALYEVCEITRWVRKEVDKSRNRVVDPEKHARIYDALEKYLRDYYTHASLGDMGIDVSDVNHDQHAILYDYESHLKKYNHARKDLLMETKFNPGVPIYNQETREAIENSVGAQIGMDCGITFSVFDLGVPGGTTRYDFETMRPKLVQDKNFQPEGAANRAMAAASNILKDAFTVIPRYKNILESFGFGRDTEAGRELEQMMYDPVAVQSINPEVMFTISYSPGDPYNIGACNKYERELMDHLVVPSSTISSIVDPATNQPFLDPTHTTYLQLLTAYQNVRGTGSDLEKGLQSAIDANKDKMYKKMVQSTVYMQDAITQLQDQLKSPLSILRTTELLSAMDLLGGSGIRLDEFGRVHQMVYAYLEGSDADGNHLSPGCTAIEPITDPNTGKQYQKVIDPIKRTTKLLPVIASLGDDELFAQAIGVLKETLADAPGGSLLTKDDINRRIARLDRLLAPSDRVEKSSWVAANIRKESGWDTLNDYDTESLERFRDICAHPADLGKLSSRWSARINATRAGPEDTTHEFKEYMNNTTAFLAASIEGTWTQINDYMRNDRTINDSVISKLARDVYYEAPADVREVLGKIVMNQNTGFFTGSIFDPWDISEAFVRYMQDFNRLEITDTVAAQNHLDEMRDIYHALSFFTQSMDDRIAVFKYASVNNIDLDTLNEEKNENLRERLKHLPLAWHPVKELMALNGKLMG